LENTGVIDEINTGASGGAKNPRVVNFIDCTGGTLPVKSRGAKKSEDDIRNNER